MHTAVLKPANRLAGAGLRAALLWIALEFTIRIVGTSVLYLRSGASVTVLNHATLYRDVVATLVAAEVLLVAIFAWKARRDGLTLTDLGYRFEQAVLPGLASAAVLFAFAFAAAWVEHSWTDLGKVSALIRQEVATGTIAVNGVFFLSNGLLTPVVEEYAWRGYIQRLFVIAWGPMVGVTVTAVLFVAKHLIVDLSTARSLSLLVLALGFGLVQHYRGTAASTIVHMGVNAAATAWVLLST